MAAPGPDRVAAMRYAAVGIEFAATVGAAVFAGFYVDEYFGTAPLFILLLTLGGMVGAFRRLLWSVKRHSPS